jgi:hypothetical protein
VTRNVGSAAAGTTFLSSDPTKVAVTPSGEIQALAPGEVVVTAINSGLQVAFSVTVEFSPVTSYGEGLAGTGGFVPVLGTGGENPTLGNAAFRFEVADVLGGAPGVLAFSDAAAAEPFANGTLLVSLPDLVGVFPVVAGGTPGAAGAGTVLVPAAVPLLPSLVGLGGYVQGAFVDPSAIPGLSLTNALRIVIVP